MTQSKLIDRIQKLLRLSKNNPSVAEAALAASMAQRLMAEHKISMAEIDTDDSKDDPIIKYDILSEEGRKIPYQWRRNLLNGVAKANFCSVVYSGQRFTGNGIGGNGAGHLWIIGTKTDIDTVRYVYQWLIKEINKLCKKNGAEIFGKGNLSRKWMNSFRIGAANEIYAILKAKKDELMREWGATKCTALVRASDAVENWMSKNMNVRTVADKNKNLDYNGYISGQRAARSIDLSDKQQLDASKIQLNG